MKKTTEIMEHLTCRVSALFDINRELIPLSKSTFRHALMDTIMTNSYGYDHNEPELVGLIGCVGVLSGLLKVNSPTIPNTMNSIQEEFTVSISHPIKLTLPLLYYKTMLVRIPGSRPQALGFCTIEISAIPGDCCSPVALTGSPPTLELPDLAATLGTTRVGKRRISLDGNLIVIK